MLLKRGKGNRRLAKHHYLPQFYLKEFTDPDTPLGQEPYVWVHRPDSGWQKRAPKNVAEESGYYTLTDDAGNEADDLERMLSRIESVAAEIIRDKVVSQTPLTEGERLDLSVFIATMQVRVPGQHEHIGEFVAEVARKTMALQAHALKQDPRRWEAFKRRFEAETGERLPEDLEPEDLDPTRYRITTNREFSVALSFSPIQLATNIIADKGWRFLMSQPPNYFITSDYPVGVHDPSTEGTLYGPALASPKTEVSLPLTKTIAILAGGEMKGIGWVPVTDRAFRQINIRTAMRATFLISPKPTAPGLELAKD